MCISSLSSCFFPKSFKYLQKCLAPKDQSNSLIWSTTAKVHKEYVFPVGPILSLYFPVGAAMN